MDIDILGGIIGLVTVILIFGVVPIGTYMYLHKLKSKKMETLVKLVELGGNVDPEMMKMLSEGGGTYKTDYKWGLIWLAIGIPVAIGVFSVAGAEGVAFSLIPMFIGIAFLLSGYLKLREPDEKTG